MSTTIINLGSASNTVTEGDDDYSITGTDGDNTLTLGNGDNQITLGNGNNTLTLGSGTDLITAGSGNNTVTTTGSGTDTITLAGGNNTVTVGDGADIITAGNGMNTVTTGNGNSHVTVGNGATDTVTVGTGSNTIALGTGIGDTLTTGAGGNTVSIAASAVGSDTITGASTTGNGSLNTLVLTTAGVISAGGVSGFQTYQLANGGANDLTLSAANFARLPGGVITVLGGNSGNTVDASALSVADEVDLYAGPGTDVLTGGAGNDSFFGGPGTTSVDGGGGFNTMTFYGPQSDYTVTVAGPTTTLVGAGSNDSLVNIQNIVFSTVAAPSGLTLAPASDSGTLGDDITNVTTPVITGTGVAGDTIALFDGLTQVGTGTVAAGGSWSITSAALADGAHSLTTVQTDPNSYFSPASTALVVTIDTTIPAAPAALTLAPASDSGTLGDDITNVTTPVITGTGVAGDTITLLDGAIPVGTGTVAAGGSWSITSATLADGAHSLTATQTDGAGNVSPAAAALVVTIDTAIPAAPAALTLGPAVVSDTPGGDITTITTPVVTGTGVAGNTITLFDGAIQVGTGTVDADGSWSITSATLAAGTHSLTAIQTDAAGNVSPAAAALVVTIVPAIRGIYDSIGTLIGTVSDSGPQPGFNTNAQRGGATTITNAGSDCLVTLMSESNTITTQGNDTVNGGAGADTIFAVGPSTSVSGGPGRLLLIGGSGATTISGGSGPVTAFGGAGGGVVQGGSGGDNVLVSGGGNTTLLGGGAGDVLVAGAGSSTLVLHPGGIAFGGVGPSTVFGAANSMLLGGSNSDVLAAGSGTEALWAGSGSSTLFGGAGNDVLAGGASGHATLVGGSGNTLFVGRGGSVQAYGGSGTDIFFTGSSRMDITEGSGSDQVVFGSGATTVTAGSGTDLFTFVKDTAGGTDVIVGFKPGTDQIQVFGYGAGAVQQSTSGGSTVINLSDGTKIIMPGLASLNSNAIV